MAATTNHAMKILIIDDDHLVLEFLTDFLGSHGYDVVPAVNGTDGLAKLDKEECVDLILSDIRMPGLNGLELLEHIKESGIEIPVILLTGFGDMKSAIKAIRAGAFDYMLKPIETESLLMRISHVEKLLELKREAEESRRRAMTMARMAAVGQLAAGVAHEINNPTTYIRGNGQIIKALERRVEKALESGSESELRDSVKIFAGQIDELLEGIETGTERIKKITMSLSRYAQGQAYEAHEEGYMNACIEDALLLIGEEKNAPVIELELKDDIKLVNMSRRNITQALVCIINNALQASKTRELGRVRITSSEGKNCVRVAVEDSGKGVPKEIRESIFDPFFTTREVNDGVGLGLTVAYGIVCGDHGGVLKLEESRLGGARFVIELPLTAKLESAQKPGAVAV